MFFTVAGISGTKDKGCNSLVLAGGYADDKDLGYEFTYSGKVSKIHIGFVFTWGGIKTRRTPDKEVWTNPINVSMGD